MSEWGMAVATLVPPEQYLSMSYYWDRKCVEGRLIEMNVGEYNHGFPFSPDFADDVADMVRQLAAVAE
jgi:hypothetical protein